MTDSSHELDFVNFWRPFVRIFQFFGIAHYGLLRPELEDRRNQLFLYRLFFAVILLIQLAGVVSFLEISLTAKIGLADKYNVSPIFAGANMTNRLSQCMCFAVIPFEIFLNRRTEQKLFETLQCIDKLYREELKHTIDYRAQYRRQMMKTWCFYIVTTLIFVSNFFITAVSEPGYITLMCVFIVSRLRMFQFAFFINTLTDLLDDLKVVMRRQQHRVKCNPARWKDIQYARQIYSNIWLVGSLIGDRFGHSMILFVANFLISMQISMYWFYLNFASIKSNEVHLS